MSNRGVMLAAAVAGLFSMGAPVAASAKDGDKVHCNGANACKGQGGCKSAENACKGKNGCKGKSFLMLTEKDCKEKGGTVGK